MLQESSMKKSAGFLILSVVFCGLAYAGDITLTTYYPAPSGAYASLRSHKMCVGATCPQSGLLSNNILSVLGRVGIGTLTPGYALQIGEGISTWIMPNTGEDALIKGNLEVDGTIFGNFSAQGLNKQVQYNDGGTAVAGATNFVFDKATGNVGIGTTTTPLVKLQVSGGALIEGLTVGRGAGAIVTNTAVGTQALGLNTTGHDNSSLGYQSLLSNTSGSNNTAMGALALYRNTLGNANTGMGYQALYNNTIGINNTAMGYQALLNNINGGSNTAMGVMALFKNNSGANNTAIGYNTLFSNKRYVSCIIFSI